MGFDLGEELGSNEVAEVEGVWIPLGDGGSIKVARLGNKEAQAAYRKIPREMRRLIETGKMDNKQAINFLASFLSGNILKDWKGLVDKGKSLPKYSPEEGAKMMKKYRRFREKVWELSAEDDNFNVDEVEQDVKN